MSTIDDFDCEVCGYGPKDGITVFRVNKKGEDGVYRCEQCHEGPIDSEVYNASKELERLDASTNFFNKR